MISFIYKDHSPGKAVLAYQITPVFKWGWFHLFHKPQIRVDWAAALCSPEDHFQPEVGHTISERRLALYCAGRANLSRRGLAGSFYVPWEDYVQLERLGTVHDAVNEITNQIGLLWPYRWSRMMQ